MKNPTYFPFERNHYYYGKLLTVDDFELEQRYSNNKRRMINRFLHGSGVVSGMHVVVVNDRSISLERGFAIDSIGREIVVDQPVTKALSDIEGFDAYEDEGQAYVYLCIEYEEKEKEVVYNVAGGNESSSSEQFNKYQESYRLFLTCEEPEITESLSGNDVYKKKHIVYQDNGIRIWQSMPKFVQAGGAFDLEIEIENMGQQKVFAFSYELNLMFMKYQNTSKLKVDFDERLFKKSSRYHLTYKLIALETDNVVASASMNCGSFRMSVAGKSLNTDKYYNSSEEVKGKFDTYIVQEKAIQALTEHYYKTETENIVKNTFRPCIHLAKIILVKAGSSYVIHETEHMPFRQYVWNNHLGFATYQFLLDEINNLKMQISNRAMKDRSGLSIEGGAGISSSFGSTELIIGKNKKKGSTFFTEEIPHGLGIGNVSITLGLEQNQGQIVYGTPSVFTDTGTPIQLAAQINADQGTFVIGAILLETNRKESYKIHWTAIKDPDYVIEDKGEKKILIHPNVLTMLVRETRYLEAICQNMNDTRVKWSVEKYGGIIDRNGMYTAPDKAGVYEVWVSSMVYPNVEASIFIIVKE